MQAAEVLQLTPATPSGRETLRHALRMLAPPTSSRTPSPAPPPDPAVPPTVISSALNLALAQQQAVHPAASGSSTSHLSSAPQSGPCSPRIHPPTYTPPSDPTTSPPGNASSTVSSDSSPLIAAAYPSSHSSTIDTASTSPRFNPAAPLNRVSADGTTDSVSVSSNSSTHVLRAGTSSPPPICRSSPLTRSSPPSGTLSPPPYSHTAFLHTVPENNGGSDDEFEDEFEDEGLGRCDSGIPGHAAAPPAIHNTSVFLLTPRHIRPCTDPGDDPVNQIRRSSACAAPLHQFVPVSVGKRCRSTADAEPRAQRRLPNLLCPGEDPTVVHGTEHSFSRVPAHIYNPLADPSLDAFDPAASPRPLSASPFLPIPVYAFGVGGSYDPEALSNIAAATGGAFQHLPQPRDLPPALAAAFGAASAAFAADVEVRVTPLCGSRVAAVHTGYPVWVEGPDVVVHIPEIAARMQKDILVTLSLPSCTSEELAAPCVKHLAGVATVSYTRARTGKHAFRKACVVLPRIEVVGSARGFGTPDPAAVTEHMRLAAAQACADAARLCRSGSHSSAQQKLLKLRSGIKQLSEVCKAANPRCNDSKRCMHARMVLSHVISDLTSAAAATASAAAFESGGRATLRAIERSHACQLPQAPASVRRCEAAQWPKGSMLRVKDRSAAAAAGRAAGRGGVDQTPEALCKAPPSLLIDAGSGAAAGAPSQAAKKVEPAAAKAAPAEASPTPARTGGGAAGKVNSMLRRVYKRVRSSRGRAADAEPVPHAAPPPLGAKAQAPPLAVNPLAPAEPHAARREVRKVDSQQVVAVRVSAYTCQAQMALVAAAVRRAEA